MYETTPPPPLGVVAGCYRGTSLIRKRPLLGSYSSPMPMAVLAGGRFLVSEVQGLHEIKDTHRPRTLRQVYDEEHRTFLRRCVSLI